MREIVTYHLAGLLRCLILCRAFELNFYFSFQPHLLPVFDSSSATKFQPPFVRLPRCTSSLALFATSLSKFTCTRSKSSYNASSKRQNHQASLPRRIYYGQPSTKHAYAHCHPKRTSDGQTNPYNPTPKETKPLTKTTTQNARKPPPSLTKPNAPPQLTPHNPAHPLRKLRIPLSRSEHQNPTQTIPSYPKTAALRKRPGARPVLHRTTLVLHTRPSPDDLATPGPLGRLS